ncbi:cysteine hydrolase [Rhizobium sp. CG5]|uniref:cysteine hydrolase family protein n=1 Tax=Rhizobium sp. CG5 TaxID=2726076 RepID=UPI002033B2E3|nr:isochorismatase family protein [Rhizobium sp. CG5]MCM2475538.1 cysteine hydrolase [Rhizobium sp. CG5]
MMGKADDGSIMVEMPLAGSRRALLVIDVQPATLTAHAAHETLGRIREYVRRAEYDAYLIATFHAPVGSMFERQLRWTLSKEDAGPSDPVIETFIAATGKPQMTLHKTLRSVFKVNDDERVRDFLMAQGVDELHLLGFDINDCVLASAYDALDRGYFTFVIEECSGRTDADPRLTEAALAVLRQQAMTNKSARSASKTIEIYAGQVQAK